MGGALSGRKPQYINSSLVSKIPMVVKQRRPKRKVTGGRYIAYRKFRKTELGRTPTLTHIGTIKRRVLGTRGNTMKARLMVAEFANVLDQKSKKFEKSKIMSVVDNPASRHFVRRNIITKGTVIQVEKGKARVTSRPGQDGMVNAVLIS